MSFKSTQTAYESAARIATPVVADTNTSKAAGVQYVIDVTAISATPNIVPTISGIDPVSGATYTLLTGAAIIATGTTVLQVHPSLAETANLKASALLPQKTRLTMSHADADSITYSVSVMLATD